MLCSVANLVKQFFSDIFSVYSVFVRAVGANACRGVSQVPGEVLANEWSALVKEVVESCFDHMSNLHICFWIFAGYR